MSYPGRLNGPGQTANEALDNTWSIRQCWSAGMTAGDARAEGWLAFPCRLHSIHRQFRERSPRAHPRPGQCRSRGRGASRICDRMLDVRRSRQDAWGRRIFAESAAARRSVAMAGPLGGQSERWRPRRRLPPRAGLRSEVGSGNLSSIYRIRDLDSRFG